MYFRLVFCSSISIINEQSKAKLSYMPHKKKKFIESFLNEPCTIDFMGHLCYTKNGNLYRLLY